MPKTRTSGIGRPKGALNHATKDVRLLAGQYGPAAIDRLAMLGGLRPPLPPAESEGAQVMAMREILDRAYGKSALFVSGDKDKPLLIDFRWADNVPAETVESKVIEAVAEQITNDTDTPEVVWQSGNGHDTQE